MIRTNFSRRAVLPVLVVVGLASGCGGPRIEGTVTLDGQPVDGGGIAFISESNPSGPRLAGTIKDGKYSIVPAELEKGTYRVEISWLKKTGKTLPSQNDPGTTVDETKEVIADEYNRNSTTKVELKSGSNTHDFNLKSGGRISVPGSGGGSEVQGKGKRPGGGDPDLNK